MLHVLLSIPPWIIQIILGEKHKPQISLLFNNFVLLNVRWRVPYFIPKHHASEKVSRQSYSFGVLGVLCWKLKGKRLWQERQQELFEYNLIPGIQISVLYCHYQGIEFCLIFISFTTYLLYFLWRHGRYTYIHTYIYIYICKKAHEIYALVQDNSSTKCWQRQIAP